MTPIQAHQLAKVLLDAAARAEVAGSDQIDMLSDLRAQDDVARAEMAAAIKAAELHNQTNN